LVLTVREETLRRRRTELLLMFAAAHAGVHLAKLHRNRNLRAGGCWVMLLPVQPTANYALTKRGGRQLRWTTTANWEYDVHGSCVHTSRCCWMRPSRRRLAQWRAAIMRIARGLSL